MFLREALQHSQCVCKHVKGEIPGTYLVSKANFAAGYYKDFKPDDPARRSPVNTSSYYGWYYPGADPLQDLAERCGEDGWRPCTHHHF